MTTIATIHIPPAALEAGARAMVEQSPQLKWEDHPGFHSIWREEARAAFEAMVKAWPKWLDVDADPGAALILPLTEKPDGE